jgi:hypothetical protein
MSKSVIVRCYGFTFVTLFIILKNKDKIQSAILCDGRPLIQKQVQNAGSNDLESTIFHWVCEEVSAAVPGGGPVIKAETKILNFHVLKGGFTVSKQEQALVCTNYQQTLFCLELASSQI